MYLHPDPAPAWEHLRAHRACPPKTVLADPERHEVFVSALDEMEECFWSAHSVHPVDRPLTLFRGMCHAGRAIAASAALLADEEWRLPSHGIRVSAGGGDGFADLSLTTDPHGSASGFVRVSEVLGSSVWGRAAVRLEDVWDCLPVNLDHPLSPRARRTPLYVHNDVGHAEHDPLLTLVVCDIPRHVLHAGTRRAWEEHLSHFPTAAACHDYACRLAVRGDTVPAYSRFASGFGGLRMSWIMPPDAHHLGGRVGWLHAMTRACTGHRYFMPAIPQTRSDLHPLSAWWAVLCALAALVHDSPAHWRSRLMSGTDPSDAAPTAVSHLLRHALTDLPVLICDALTESVSPAGPLTLSYRQGGHL